MSEKRHIFLSYRSVDFEFALRLAVDLKNAGVNLWMDRLDIKPGDDWARTLADGVSNCVAMISVISPEYVQSRYCQRELARADRLERLILPVMLRPVNESDMPLEIARTQYIDFSRWTDDRTYQEQLQRLVDFIREHFADQVSVAPDPQIRYINELIARLEADSGAIELPELPGDGDQAPNGQTTWRPRPRFAKAWDAYGAFAIVPWPGSEPKDGDSAPQRQRKRLLNGIREAVDKYPRFVLIGAPGSGKSTVLNHLVLDAAHTYQSAPRTSPMPLLLRLVNWTALTTPEEFVRAHWPFDTDVLKLLKKGRVNLYLDGLNELGQPDERIPPLREWLTGDSAPQRIVVTCRASDYRTEWNLGLPVIQTMDMDRQRIQQFVTGYLKAEDVQAFMARMAEIGGQEAGTQIPWLSQPTLLSYLLLVYQMAPEQDLPQNVGMLMRRVVSDMWRSERTRQLADWVTQEELEDSLTDLASAITERDLPIYVPQEFALEQLGGRLLLEAAAAARILQVEGGNVRFSHLYLKSYFAARKLKSEDVESRLVAPSFDASGRRIQQPWDLSFVLLSGMSPDPDTLVTQIAEIDPFLALECLVSGTSVLPLTRLQIVNRALDRMRDSNLDGRVAVGELLAALSHEMAVPTLLDAAREGKWEARQTAVNVIQDMKLPHLPGLGEALEVLENDLRDATAVALQQLGDAALPTLFQLLDHDNWSLRRNAAWALGQISDRAATPLLVNLLNDEDNLVSIEAAAALGRIRDADSVPYLMLALQHDNSRVRRAASSALGWIGMPALDRLMEMLKTSDVELRRLVISALQGIHHERALEALLTASHDDNPDVRCAAIEAFEHTEDPLAVKRLIECLSDNGKPRWGKQRIAEVAARILEAIGTPEAFAAVENWRRTRSSRGHATPASGGKTKGERRSRKNVTAAAGTAGMGHERLKKAHYQNTPAEGVPGEASASKGKKAAATSTDTNEKISERARQVTELEKMDVETALPRLLMALHEEDSQAKLVAIRVLSQIESASAMEGLLQALNDHDHRVAEAAADGLKHFGARATPGLMRALESSEVDRRASALRSLIAIADKAAVPTLIEQLADTARPVASDERICDLAGKALEAIGTPEALEAVEHWRKIVPAPAPDAATPPVQAKLDQFEITRKGYDQRDILIELLEAIRVPGWPGRQEAAKALREYAKLLQGSNDPEIMRRLTDALGDQDWIIRWAAAESLAWIKGPAAVPALMARMGDSHWMVRVSVIRSLLEIGDRGAAQSIVPALSDPKDLVREAAAEALGALGDASVIPVLEKAAQDRERFVRLAAVDALSKLVDASSTRSLVKSLDDEDAHVRWAVVQALSQLARPDMVPDLAPHLYDDDGPYWEEKKIGDLVADILERLATPEATAALTRWKQIRAELKQSLS